MNDCLDLVRDYYAVENQRKCAAIDRALWKRLLPLVRKTHPFEISAPLYSTYNNTGFRRPLRPKPEALPFSPLSTEWSPRLDGTVAFPTNSKDRRQGIDIPAEEDSSAATAFINWYIVGPGLSDAMEEAHAKCAELVDFRTDYDSLPKLRHFKDSAEDTCDRIRTSLNAQLRIMAAELELFILIATSGRSIEKIPSHAQLGETLRFFVDENDQPVEKGAWLIEQACDEFGAAEAFCGWVQDYLWSSYAQSKKTETLRPLYDAITKAFGKALGVPQTYTARLLIELSLLRREYQKFVAKETKARARSLAAEVLIKRTIEADSIKLLRPSIVWTKKPRGNAKATPAQKREAIGTVRATNPNSQNIRRGQSRLYCVAP